MMSKQRNGTRGNVLLFIIIYMRCPELGNQNTDWWLLGIKTAAVNGQEGENVTKQHTANLDQLVHCRGIIVLSLVNHSCKDGQFDGLKTGP